MKKNRKLFVFDFDGTLVTSNNKMLDETIEALKKVKEKGHIIAIATGRPLIFLKDNKATKIFDYLICNNGTYYLNQNTNKKYVENTLSQKIVLKMIKMARKNKSILIVNDVNNVVGIIFGHNKKTADEFNKHWKEKIKIATSKSIFNYINKDLITQSSILAVPQKLKIIKQELIENKDEIEIKIANLKYVDANPKNISKYSTIKKIYQEINIANDDVVTFGDSGNDIEMLKKAGTGIAMENGTKEAKAAANQIIGNNNSPAIANKILEIIDK